eukprot:643274-Rhodomonas_salina.2
MAQSEQTDATWLRPGTGEKFNLEKTASGLYSQFEMEVNASAQPGPPPKASKYHVSRDVVLRLMSFTFLAAFCSLFVQIQSLLGSEGLFPVTETLEHSKHLSFWSFPTAVGLAKAATVDVWMDIMCLLGIVMSIVGVVGHATFTSVFSCWFLYLSFVTVGEQAFSFEWDMLLLEAGSILMASQPHVRC